MTEKSWHIFNTARSALFFPFRNILSLVRLGFFPFLLTFAVCLGAAWIILPESLVSKTPEDDEHIKNALFAVNLIAYLGSAILAIIFATGIHRLVIYGEPAKWTFFRSRRFEIAYGAVVIMFAIPSYGASYLFAAISSSLGLFLLKMQHPSGAPNIEDLAEKQLETFSPIQLVFLTIILLLFLLACFRLSLMFPDAAVRARISPMLSWRATKGNFWRFVTSGLILLIAATFIFMFFYLFVVRGLLTDIHFQLSEPGIGTSNSQHIMDKDVVLKVFGVFMIITAPLSGFFFAMGVAFISYVYKNLLFDPASQTSEHSSGAEVEST